MTQKDLQKKVKKDSNDLPEGARGNRIGWRLVNGLASGV
jgi:hypothetical protein